MADSTREKWRRRFKRASPTSYKEALEYDVPGLEVIIVERKDLFTLRPAFSVIVDDPRSGCFTMESFPTARQAAEFCDQMGWLY